MVCGLSAGIYTIVRGFNHGVHFSAELKQFLIPGVTSAEGMFLPSGGLVQAKKGTALHDRNVC